MRMKTFVSALIMSGLLILGGCNSQPVESPPSEMVILDYGQSVTLPDSGTKITFDSILVESRCPIDALILCIWEGLATIQVSVERPGEGKAQGNLTIAGFVDLDGENPYPYGIIDGYKIGLRQLLPYPNIDSAVTPASYKAWLEVIEDGDRYPYPVMFVGNPMAIAEAPYTVNDFAITNYIADINVSYGGGCTEHDLYLYMSPVAFEKSLPAQADLYIQHFDYGDNCEALITRPLTYDLEPIADFYTDTFGIGGDIILNLYEWDGDEFTKAARATMRVDRFLPD